MKQLLIVRYRARRLRDHRIQSGRIAKYFRQLPKPGPGRLSGSLFMPVVLC